MWLNKVPWRSCLLSSQYQFLILVIILVAVVQLLNCVRLFATPWTVARQASLSFTFPSLLKLMSIESVMLLNHLSFLSSSPLPAFFPSIRIFSNELALCIRWPKYWSFSISPSNEYSGLISKINLFDLLACPRDSQESSPPSQFKSINSSALCLLYGPALTTIHDYLKDHSLDYMDLYQQSDVSAF